MHGLKQLKKIVNTAMWYRGKMTKQRACDIKKSAINGSISQTTILNTLIKLGKKIEIKN